MNGSYVQRLLGKSAELFNYLQIHTSQLVQSNFISHLSRIRNHFKLF